MPYCVKGLLAVLLCLGVYPKNISAQPLETGPIGYYSSREQGAPTLLGEVYDRNKMTCAHKFYPINTYLRITRIDNSLSVTVRVNDRLSARSGEVVIVSEAVAGALQLDPDRITIVQIENVGKADNLPGVYYNTSPQTVQASRTVATPQAYDQIATPQTTSRLTAKGAVLPRSYEAPSPSPALSSGGFEPKISLPTAFKASSDLVARGISTDTPTAYEVVSTRAPRAADAGIYYLQTAAFANYENAQQHYQELRGRGIAGVRIVPVTKADGSLIYRSWIGPYPNVAAAKAQQEVLAREYRLRGLVVQGN